MTKQLCYFSLLLASCAGAGGNTVLKDSDSSHVAAASKDSTGKDSIMLVLHPTHYRVAVMKAPETDFELTEFDSVPAEIEGCSGYYATDSVQLKKQRYIFLLNMQTLALLNTGDTVISLHWVGSSESSMQEQSRHFAGEGYDVMLDVDLTKDKWEIDESSDYAGRLIIFHEGKRQIIPITGTEGC